ncbi:hypothetical protein NBZ79_19240 [Sneathiella marina]|uniref:PEP-CTERM protein-sorting domain-containing protein n=1 Tax=Sneathiella marina TaxID=2950108 RepID=A0ABY4W2A4_9PROT|nr:hypothetical protein [Sneathiella marina]USG61296.1 hypothetical protein NBZ79_19240 [Sneathiella marina]
MKFRLSCQVVILTTMLHMGSVSAAPLSTGAAQTPDAANPAVQTQLNMTEYSEVAQAPMVKAVDSAGTKGVFSNMADDLSTGKIPFSPALILFGFALAAIGWMGRKRKKSFLVKD